MSLRIKILRVKENRCRCNHQELWRVCDFALLENYPVSPSQFHGCWWNTQYFGPEPKEFLIHCFMRQSKKHEHYVCINSLCPPKLTMVTQRSLGLCCTFSKSASHLSNLEFRDTESFTIVRQHICLWWLVFCSNLTRRQYTVIYSNTNLGAAVKVFCRYD